MAKKRWRSKESRAVVAAVAKAGGTVEETRRGHLRVTGPGGIAIVASDLSTGRHTLANTLATIQRKAGLRITV